MIYDFLIGVLDAFNAMVLVYFVVLSAGYFITGLFAFRSLRRYVRRLVRIKRALADLWTAS